MWGANYGIKNESRLKSLLCTFPPDMYVTRPAAINCLSSQRAITGPEYGSNGTLNTSPNYFITPAFVNLHTGESVWEPAHTKPSFKSVPGIYATTHVPSRTKTVGSDSGRGSVSFIFLKPFDVSSFTHSSATWNTDLQRFINSSGESILKWKGFVPNLNSLFLNR